MKEFLVLSLSQSCSSKKMYRLANWRRDPYVDDGVLQQLILSNYGVWLCVCVWIFLTCFGQDPPFSAYEFNTDSSDLINGR